MNNFLRKELELHVKKSIRLGNFDIRTDECIWKGLNNVFTLIFISLFSYFDFTR